MVPVEMKNKYLLLLRYLKTSKHVIFVSLIMHTKEKNGKAK